MCDQDHYDDDLRQYQKAWGRMLVLFKKALA